MSLKAWFAAAALLLASSATYANIVPGKDFTSLRQPQRTEAPAGNTEVIEFFNFACPGCYQLHRTIMAWAAKLPGTVSFRRVPVVYSKPGWAIMARAAYALEVTGDLHRVDTALFDAIHKERLPLFEERALVAWMVKHGVDGAKFTAAFNSFGVNTRLSQNDRMIARYEIASVPSVVIDGRYTTQGDSWQQMLSNADQLIARAKAERSSSTKKS